MPRAKINEKTDESREKRLYQTSLRARMDSWDCFHRKLNKRILCRNLLLHLIKVNIAFPKYREVYPSATIAEMEELWANNKTKSPTAAPTSPPKSGGSPTEIAQRCPRCESYDIVHEGFAGATAICTTCGHTWMLIGGGRHGPDLGPRASTNWFQIPVITEYVDKRGQPIDPKFPRIFPEKQDPREKYFIKSLNEIVENFRTYNRQMEIRTFSRLTQTCGGFLAKYLQSLPEGKGMPKTQKRRALIAVIGYYGSVMSNQGLSWEQLSNIFGVLTEDMEKIRDREMEKFWMTTEGAKISADLFPALARAESRKIPEGAAAEARAEARSPSGSGSIESRVFNKLKKARVNGATRLGVDGFIMGLRGINIKLLITRSGKKRGEINKQTRIVEEWYDERPLELESLLGDI